MKYLLSLLAILLVGCANSPQHRYSRLATGMTKQQVIALLGQPRSSTSNGALITMEYDLGGRSSYYVIIGRDERVRSFGPN